MQEFFTWAMLGTYAGAVMATTLITQLIKGALDRFPTRWVSYCVAVVALLLGSYFTGNLTLADGVLCLFNAVIVSLAANGGFDAVTAKRG